MANVWEAMKKHQAEQAAREQVQEPEEAPLPLPAPAAQAPPPETPQASAPAPTAPAQAAAVAVEEAPVAKAIKTAAPPAQTAPPERLRKSNYSPCLLAYHDRGGRIAEEYRSLRTNLLAQCGQRGFCYQITSAEPGEGKTVSCLNLAMVLAERVDQNTLVIDADLRRHKIADMLALKRSPGLADCLRGQVPLKQALQVTEFDNLSILSAGVARQPEVAELLGRLELEKLLAEARRMFDYVIIDTPPINSVSDAGIIGRSCNEALIVVRMNRTRRESVQRAISLLRSANIKPMGTVMTHQKYFLPNYIYHYT